MLDESKHKNEGGKDNVNLHPELNGWGCGVDERDQECVAQKTKDDVNAGAVYNSGYEHSKCSCDVSNGKAALT